MCRERPSRAATRSGAARRGVGRPSLRKGGVAPYTKHRPDASRRGATGNRYVHRGERDSLLSLPQRDPGGKRNTGSLSVLRCEKALPAVPAADAGYDP